MARMPCRAQASMICSEIALLADRRGVQRQPAMIGGKIPHHASMPRSREHRLHAPRRQFGIGEQSGLVGEPEQFGEMQRRARALLPADHGEMILMAVEIGHEHDAGLVEPRRRLEDMARQRHRRPQHVVETGLVAGREPRQRVGRRRRDGIEDAEQRVGKALVVAGDQFGVVEIVAGIHLHVLVEPAAHVDLALLVEQRDLDAVDLGGVGVDDADRDIHRRVEVWRAPVIRQRRIEHVAEPVDDHGLARPATARGYRPWRSRRRCGRFSPARATPSG